MKNKYKAILKLEESILLFNSILSRTDFIRRNNVDRGLCYLVEKSTNRILTDSYYRFNTTTEGITSLCCNQLENCWEVRTRGENDILFTGDLEACKKFREALK